MPRPSRATAAAVGHDSFLDIVANMVGILIILVMVVGVRVKNAPVVAAISGNAAEDRELEKDLAAEASMRNDVLKAARQIGAVQSETLAQSCRRDLLATAVAALQHKIASRRERMDAQSRRDFDFASSLALARRQVEQLQRERADVEKAKAEPTVVKNYPTPLSRTVDGREAHFQLRDGRIVYVPLSVLLDRLRDEFHRSKYKLRDRTEVVDTIGPIDGFRLKYILVRHEIPPETAVELGYSGQIIRLRRALFIPVSAGLGETVDAALAEGSEFRGALAKFRPGRHAVTIWTYQDSFAELRKIKDELHRLGFSCAARPLENGEFISGSPEGSKSAAQ